jgi:hypothetical protein
MLIALPYWKGVFVKLLSGNAPMCMAINTVSYYATYVGMLSPEIYIQGSIRSYVVYTFPGYADMFVVATHI